MFEGVDPGVLGAVRALAREVRYRPLDQLVGRRVQVASIGATESAVRSAVPELSAGATLLCDGDTMRLALAKYGLIDLRFRVDRIDAPAIGYRSLRALGLLERVDDGLKEPDPRDVLDDWLEECRCNWPLVMLFLRGPQPREVVPRWRDRGGWKGELVDEYLPRELTIIDACETNAGFVWMAKHFYL